MGTFCSKIFNGCSRASVSSTSHRISIFFCPLAFPFTRFILCLTRSTFIAAFCSRQNHCAILSWRSLFSLSWSLDQLFVSVIFSCHLSRRLVFGGGSFGCV